jgi:hypothetical protein
MKDAIITGNSYPKSEIFVGPPASGKSRRALEIGEGKEQVYIIFRRKMYIDPFLFANVKPETELLVFDDVPANYVLQLLTYLFPFDITVNAKGKSPFKIRRPHTIITVEGKFEMPQQATFTRRFTVLKFPEAAPAHWAQEGGVSNV